MVVGKFAAVIAGVAMVAAPVVASAGTAAAETHSAVSASIASSMVTKRASAVVVKKNGLDAGAAFLGAAAIGALGVGGYEALRGSCKSRGC